MIYGKLQLIDLDIFFILYLYFVYIQFGKIEINKYYSYLFT